MATLLSILTLCSTILVIVLIYCILKRCMMTKQPQVCKCNEHQNIVVNCNKCSNKDIPPYVQNQWTYIGLSDKDINRYKSLGYKVSKCHCTDDVITDYDTPLLVEGGGDGGTKPTTGGLPSPVPPPPPSDEGSGDYNFISQITDNFRVSKDLTPNTKNAENAMSKDGVRIAVIDTGLYNNLYELKGFSRTGCSHSDREDQSGHGSIVSFILYEKLKNLGTNDFTIYPYNATNDNNDLTLFHIMCAISHAASVKKVHVINLSLGIYSNVPILRYFIQKITIKHPYLIFVCSAGNENFDLNFVDHAPSLYHRNCELNVIQVSGFDHTSSQVWDLTNAEFMVKNVVEQAVHTFSGNNTVEGTSFAAPIITALVANKISNLLPNNYSRFEDAREIKKEVEVISGNPTPPGGSAGTSTSISRAVVIR